ncbi:hypothetical protein [Sphingobium sp.]|uniref:hypothetical protein n=1 Tax=Sphingobium sp. TaxID=1912891 RepID=UPI0035C7667C
MTTSAFEIDSAASNSIVVAVAQNPAIVLVDQGKRADLFAHIQQEIDAFTPDLSTARGRDAIKSFAFKITRTKTAIDDAGKKLNEEARAKIAVVDAARRDAREKLDEMAKGVRKPLTDWEEAEKARVAECDAIINKMALDGVVTLDDTSETVRQRGKAIWETVIEAERFGDKFDQAMRAKEHAVDMLKSALARLIREEEERAELERLRAAEAERVAKEQAERERREAVERAAAEAKAEEERRAAAETAEQERIAAAKREAEDRARAEAEAAAEAERQRIQREHEEALAAERRRTEEAERARQAEVDRIAREDAARKAEADRLAAEQAARAADEAHRSEVKAKAAGALVAMGLAERTAFRVVQAICANDIPHVRLEF